ncbi:MAG: flagellar protein FlaG [Deltaproteobacteria bacterium]|nr:flagellar protein FlaG [Deltaproteobacteria bacterium]
MDISIKDVTMAPVQTAHSAPAAPKKTMEPAAGLFSKPAEAKNDAPPQKIEEAASDVQIQLKRLNTELRFEVDKDSKDVIVRIIDPETKQVIRQIPSEELMAIRARMQELIGVLYNSKT